MRSAVGVSRGNTRGIGAYRKAVLAAGGAHHVLDALALVLGCRGQTTLGELRRTFAAVMAEFGGVAEAPKG